MRPRHRAAPLRRCSLAKAGARGRVSGGAGRSPERPGGGISAAAARCVRGRGRRAPRRGEGKPLRDARKRGVEPAPPRPRRLPSAQPSPPTLGLALGGRGSGPAPRAPRSSPARPAPPPCETEVGGLYFGSHLRYCSIFCFLRLSPNPGLPRGLPGAQPPRLLAPTPIPHRAGIGTR